MSRVSSPSRPSASATRGSSRIDLGKNSDISISRKTQPSATIGGIGVTQEVASIGGVTVTGGVRVEIAPIGLDISGNPDYDDPSKSTVSIAGGAEVPGGIIGVSGGVTINTSTGEIEGGSIGGEIAGIGVNVSNSKRGGLGVEVSVQIPFTPIEISLGFGFPKKEEPTPTLPPAPAPAPAPNEFPEGTNRYCNIVFALSSYKREYYNGGYYESRDVK